MIVISERELGICCDSGDCTAQAWYVVTIKTAVPYARLYCAQHTAELLQRAVEVLRDGENLHEYIESEHLMKGATINA